MKNSIAALSGLLAFTALRGAPCAHDAAVVVHIHDFAFDPRTVAIVRGTTVTFINDDAEPHTVTALDKTFDSGGLDTHESWHHAFPQTGTFAFLCDLHPYMKGTIVVRALEAGR